MAVVEADIKVELDMAAIKASLDRVVKTYGPNSRTARINRANQTALRKRTAEQAALVAVGRLIQDGTFR